VFSASPVLVLLAFNILFLGKKFRDIAPRWKDVHFKYSKNLFGLGVQFFIIQIAFLVLYSSANLILTQLFGPQEVTVYNVAYKYFTIALMINGIITATYWSAFTDAYTRGEMTWISNAIRKLEYITYLLMGMVVVSTLISGNMFHLWLGDSVHVPVSMRTVMCIYALISLISAPQHIFLNGTGKVRLQLYSAIFSIVMTVPLALFFCKVLHLGPEGVVLAMTCTTLPVTILYKIQYSRIMKGNASGIWNQ